MTSNNLQIQTIWGRIFFAFTILTLTASASTLGLKRNSEICCGVTPLLINLKASLNETFDANNYTMSKWGLDASDNGNELDIACRIATLDALGNNNGTNMQMTEICQWLYYPATYEIPQCKEDLYNYCFKNSTTVRNFRIFNNEFGQHFRC